MARKSRTALLERYAREGRVPRPTDGRDWVPVAELDLAPPAELDARNGVAVTRAFAGTLR